MTPTCKCGRPVDGTTLCHQCQHTLDVALANIPAYAADAELTETRRQGVRYDRSGGSGGTKEPPAPGDIRFLRGGKGARARDEARNAVVTWCRVILDEHPDWPGPARDTLASACGWLQGHLQVIAVAVWADDCMRDLLAAERALWRIDDWTYRQYVGRCSADPDDDNGPCEAELYARQDAATVKCQACGTRHDVAARREFMLDQAKDYLVTATEAAGALIEWTGYGGSQQGLADRIRKWRDRGRLEVADVTSLSGRDRHLYRLGDIQDLLIEHAQREQVRRVSSA